MLPLIYIYTGFQ